MSESKLGRFRLTKAHYMPQSPGGSVLVLAEGTEVTSDHASANMEPLDDQAKILMDAYKAEHLRRENGAPATPPSLDDMIDKLSPAEKAALAARLVPPAAAPPVKSGR